VDEPFGVAISPDGQRIYVAETGGHRLIKILDRSGKQISSFKIPATSVGERSPVYIAVDRSGRVFVADRLQGAIYAFSADGAYIDEIISPTTTLSEYVAKHLGGGLPEGSVISYNAMASRVSVKVPGSGEQTLPQPDVGVWNPLGVRFDAAGNLWITDVLADAHRVRRIDAAVMTLAPWLDFNPVEFAFGAVGGQPGQFRFPNTAVADGKGRVYVSDGNNGRISVWDGKGTFLYQFGRGNGGAALSLPRGIWIDYKDRLYVVDSSGHSVKVFDVSGDQAAFLKSFGTYGIDRGQFNYPNDIVGDQTGRLYIADRVNNRIEVWSY
jgi:DNA-binding beta-propeller fold protein YncE